MKKSQLIVVAYAILFLFFIQLAGSLVESIYVLDLLNTSLDAKALGLLFFFSPVLLLFFRKKLSTPAVWALFIGLIAARGILPYLDTTGRLLAAGLGTSCVLLLFPILITTKMKGECENQSGLWISAGLALATALSVFLRTVNYSLDISLLPEGGWIGWALGAGLGYFLTLWDFDKPWGLRPPKPSVKLPTAGIFLVITLVYFAYSAPGVIARWTEGNYALIVSAVSLMALGWAALCMIKFRWIDKITPGMLLVLNLLFTAALTGTILASQISFPQTPTSTFVVESSPSMLEQLPLFFMLLLFPVIFVDIRVLANRIFYANPTPRDMVPGLLLGSGALVGLVFMYIFTNVWGYIEPVSPWFRNKFWLPFLLMAALITLLVGVEKWEPFKSATQHKKSLNWGGLAFLGILFLATAGSSIVTTQTQSFEAREGSLVVMTYNIQQANDGDGQRSYDRQLALIQQVSPDVVALQESDSARVSLNNNDYVRYYAGKLGYYSYYGPDTVTGTYGTAILSKYPLEKPRTVFTYSDKDEIGTAEAEITINDRVFTIYNVHPDGSDTAMLSFAQSLVERSRKNANVIILGDYNLRVNEEAYQLIANVYTNAWESVHPSGSAESGTDTSNLDRIDHIFFSPSLKAKNPYYVLAPESATDHPMHWAELYWEK